MTKSNPKTKLAPEAISYRQLELPSEFLINEQSLKELRDNIVLQTQGESVEMSEEHPTPLLMVAFDVAHKISPEAVLRLKTGERVLLFDHQSAPVIRDADVILQFADPEKHRSKTNNEEFIPELTLNLEEFWNQDKHDDYFSVLKSALKSTLNSVRPAMVATLVGKAPALLFLLVQHQLHGKTGEIWHQDSPSATSTRITKL